MVYLNCLKVFLALFLTYTEGIRVNVETSRMNNIPIVVNTWGFTVATDKAWEVIYHKKQSAVDAVEAGCGECQIQQCDFTVGYGGSPDENGETTLDAMIMDGPSHNMGAVGALRGIKNAIGVARKVMENTKHSFLVGSQASEFAKTMGFKDESLSTNYSIQLWKDWKSNNCQPNFWQDVSPDPTKSCGPYHSAPLQNVNNHTNRVFTEGFGNSGNHDTVGMVVIDNEGRVAVGTSSNGAKHKIPGRVGDSPLAGAGAYVDQDIGGAAATGDGDIMLRLLPSYQIVENMRLGMSPEEAATDAMARIIKKFPNFMGGLIAVSKDGNHGRSLSGKTLKYSVDPREHRCYERFYFVEANKGASCHGIESFPYCVRNISLENTTIFNVKCL